MGQVISLLSLENEARLYSIDATKLLTTAHAASRDGHDVCLQWAVRPCHGSVPQDAVTAVSSRRKSYESDDEGAGEIDSEEENDRDLNNSRGSFSGSRSLDAATLKKKKLGSKSAANKTRTPLLSPGLLLSRQLGWEVRSVSRKGSDVLCARGLISHGSCLVPLVGDGSADWARCRAVIRAEDIPVKGSLEVYLVVLGG
jgi:hypothetical protein